MTSKLFCIILTKTSTKIVEISQEVKIISMKRLYYDLKILIHFLYWLWYFSSHLNVLFIVEYRILGKKGEGTFSEVLKCQSIEDGQYYACKRMKQHFDR